MAETTRESNNGHFNKHSRELGTGGSQSERKLARIVRAGGSPGLKLVNLALPGGGGHGAFAWGVLDRGGVAMDGIRWISAKGSCTSRG